MLGLRPAADSKHATSRISCSVSDGSNPGSAARAAFCRHRRTDHEHAVVAGGGDFQSAPWRRTGPRTSARSGTGLERTLGPHRMRSVALALALALAFVPAPRLEARANASAVRHGRPGSRPLRASGSSAVACRRRRGWLRAHSQRGKIISRPLFAPAINAGRSLRVSRNEPPSESSP